MKIRILARAVIHDPKGGRILLVRNRGTSFWYAPGGGWEYENENIIECAKREVREEVGLNVDIKKMLYLQEFHATEDSIFFEVFWLATPQEGEDYNERHVDLDLNGQVEEAKWFTKAELGELKVYPKRLKNTFWEKIQTLSETEDPFIGVS